MHHYFASKFLIETRNNLGFSCSYDEVKLYEHNADVTNKSNMNYLSYLSGYNTQATQATHAIQSTHHTHIHNPSSQPVTWQHDIKSLMYREQVNSSTTH